MLNLRTCHHSDKMVYTRYNNTSPCLIFRREVDQQIDIRPNTSQVTINDNEIGFIWRISPVYR